MSTLLLISGSVHSPSTMIWYISEVTQSCTVIVRVAEVVSPLGGVTLLGAKLYAIPGSELTERLTGALKLLMEVM